MDCRNSVCTAEAGRCRKPQGPYAAGPWAGKTAFETLILRGGVRWASCGSRTTVWVDVIDTAGLRGAHEATDEVERIGMARNWTAITEADAVIFLHDLTRHGQADYEAAEVLIAARLAADGGVQSARIVPVYNKADAAPGGQHLVTANPEPGDIVLSARTGDGLDVLRQTLLQRAGWQASTEGVVIARKRHLLALQRTAAHRQAARGHAAVGDTALDLFAEELRLAHDALSETTGAFSVNDLLGEIFGNFCIGK